MSCNRQFHTSPNYWSQYYCLLHVVLTWWPKTVTESQTLVPSLSHFCDYAVEASWNVMTYAQKPGFVFQLNGRVHLNRRRASVQSTTGSRDVRISGSNARYTMFRGSVKGTGTSFASCPFTSPPVCHRVPSHFNWRLLTLFYCMYNPTPWVPVFLRGKAMAAWCWIPIPFSYRSRMGWSYTHGSPPCPHKHFMGWPRPLPLPIIFLHL